MTTAWAAVIFPAPSWITEVMPYILELQTFTKWIPGYWAEYTAESGYWAPDPAAGWNAGAHSLVWLQQPPPGYEGITARYTFKVRKESLGIFVGLASNDAGTSPGDVLAGVYLSMGQWRPVSDGTPLAGGGAFDDGTLFTLTLTPAGLEISTPDAAEFVPRVMPSAVCLDAALYLKDDEILSADVACGGGQLGVLAPVQALASNGPIGHANSVLAAVVGRAGMHEGCAGELAPLGGAAWVGAGLGLGVLTPMQAEGLGSGGGAGGGGVGAAFQQAVLAPMMGVCIVRSGYSGQQHGGVLAPVYDAWAYGGFGRALSGQPNAALASPDGVAYGTEGDHIAAWGESVYVRTPMAAQPLVVLVLNSRGRVVSMFETQAVLDATVEGKVQALGSIAGDMSLLAYIDAVVRGADGLQGQAFGAGAPLGGGPGGGQLPHGDAVQQPADGTADYDGGYFVWVFNARTGGVSRYLRYGFDSFAQIGGHYFGAAEDGVYLLEGSTDGTQPIQARAGTGLLDLGAKELKHISAVYLDAASDGVLSVRVQAGQQQYTYQARRASQHNAQQRVDTGRGLRATHYSFELLNGGADFELDAMDVNVVKSARRI